MESKQRRTERLQALYLDFVLAHMVCPTIHDGCKGCLPDELLKRVTDILESPESDGSAE